MIRFHPHALERMKERGASKSEVREAIQRGEQFAAKFGRTGFRKNFLFEREWNNKFYQIKQIEVFAVQENSNWLVITVITRYF